MKNFNTVEDILSVLNDKDLNNCSFINTKTLEYAMDKKLYGVIDAIFYLLKVEYVFKVNKNYELLLPIIERYYKKNSLDLKLSSNKIYNTFEDFLSTNELDVFVENSTIEKTLNSRIYLILDCNANLLYKKQYIETLSDYIKKINPFENNKIIKEAKKELFFKNVTLNFAFVGCFIGFILMYFLVKKPDQVLQFVNIPHQNLKFMFEMATFNLYKILILISSIFVFLHVLKNNILRSIIIFLLFFFSINTCGDFYNQLKFTNSTPVKESVQFDKVFISEDYITDTVVKSGIIDADSKQYIWPDNLKIKKGVKYEIEHYNNLIVSAKEQKSNKQ